MNSNVVGIAINTWLSWLRIGCSSEVCRAACGNCYKYLSYSSSMDTLALLYFAESSFLCRFRVDSVNVFVLPRFDFCTSDIFFINKQFRTCAGSLSGRMNIGRVNIEFFPGWKKIKQGPFSFVLFTYDIMKNFNCNISLWFFFKSKFRSYIGKLFLN